LLAGAWVGAMAALGFIAAPVLFATLARVEAGRMAARLFEIDADVGLMAGAVLLVLALGRARAGAARGGSRFSAEMLLALAALSCIVAGYFALQPMLEAARLGQGSLSFAALHGIAAAFFVVKLGVVAVLAWRLSARAQEATVAAPPSSG
jgi:hypothetical protein